MAVFRLLETVQRVSCRVAINMKRPEDMLAKNQEDSKANRDLEFALPHIFALYGSVLILSIER